MEHLNRQLRHYSSRLQNEVGLSDDEAKKVASYVSADVRFLAVATKDEIKSGKLKSNDIGSRRNI